MTDSVTVDGTTLEQNDELYTEQQYRGISAGIYMRVEAFYEGPHGEYATFSFANGKGPDEVDLPVEDVVQAIGGGSLSFKEYDTQMHD